MEYTGRIQIVDQFKYVWANFLNIFMLLFIDIVGQNMDLAMVFGKVGSNFFTDESARQMRDLKGTFDPVVIGDGNVGHPL